MPLDINGYNRAFKSFVDFAQERFDENQAKAVADACIKKFNGEEVLTIAHAKTDEVHKWLRKGDECDVKGDECDVNDRTRAIFRAAVVNMFGGESKIPASVKKAMLMEDYDKGKPLTARRILAVKAAIDADGTAKARSATIRLETLDDPANEAAMLAKGYTKAELPRLARAAHFYAEVNHCAEFEALEELTKPGSKANRLMQYGGRFLESAANFREGLRLIDSFAAWFAETKATLDATGKNYQEGMGKTILNGSSFIFDNENLHGLEKFVFEELACNAAHDLSEQNPEKLFGVENNAATRFFGRGLGKSFTQTVANIPPARRAAFYAAMDTVFPLISDPAVARLPVYKRITQGFETVSDINRGIIIARIMKNLDKLQALFDKGQLTLRNFVKTCIPEARHNTIAGVNDFIDKWWLELRGDENRDIEPKYPLNLGGPLQITMETTGCTIDEAFVAVNGGKQPPIPKYFATGTLPLSAFDGTTRGARNEFEGDANRPAQYSIKDGQQNILLDDAGFRFTFPDGTTFKTNATAEGRAQIAPVADKVEALCGAVHSVQASSVLTMLSQSGLGDLCGGLRGYGIASNEHSAVNYTLSKDPATNAVTIKYTSPEELPFRFEWTATVDVFGNITSTPMKFEQPVAQLNGKTARAKVDAVANGLGIKLTSAQANEAAGLLKTHGTNMYSRNADLFAKFLVRLVTAGGQGADKAAIAADTANSIRMWRDVGFGDSVFSSFNEAAKNHASNTIRKYMQPGQAGKFTNNIFETMTDDAHRATYILNGTTYNHKPANELIPAFKALVPDAKKQRALSIYLNQLCLETVLLPTTHVPYETGVNLPGSNALVNRDMMSGLYQSNLLFTTGHGLTHDLKLSEDGKTATITQSLTADLSGLGSNMNDPKSFGQVTFSQRLVIDLEPEIPVVTDYRLSQTIA